MGLVCWSIIDSVVQLTRINRDLYTHPFAVSNAALEAQLAASSIRNELLLAVMSHDLSNVEQAISHIENLDKKLQQNLTVIQAAFLGDQTQVARVQEAAAQWPAIRQQIFHSAQTGRFDKAQAISLTQGTALHDKLAQGLDYIISYARAKASFFVKQAEQHTQETIISAKNLLYAGILLALVIGFFTVRRVLYQLDKNEASLREAASVFENTADAVIITDAQERITMVNRAFSEITGFAMSEAIGQTPRLLKSDRHTPSFYTSLWSALKNDGKWNGQIWNRKKNGEAFLALETISPVFDRHSRIAQFIAVFSDITELHRQQELDRHRAYHDALTGLPNRFLLQDRLQHAITLSRHKQVQLVLMLIDLNRFKVINDTLGHATGDLVLVEIAERLRQALRRSDTVARLGGDEFVVLLLAEDAAEVWDSVTEFIERIQEVISTPMQIQEHNLSVGSSIGVAHYPNGGEDAETLLKNADTAMYAAKATGVDGYCYTIKPVD